MRTEGRRKLVITLLGLGFDYQTIMAMPETEAWQYLEALEGMKQGNGKSKKYRVKRK